MKPFIYLVLVTQFVLSTRAAKGDADTSKRDPATALTDYIKRPDKAFAWHLRGRVRLAAGECVELILTSQTWHDTVWKHQLFIYKPAKVTETKYAVFVIDGGDWDDRLDSKPDGLTSDDLPGSMAKYAKVGDAANCIVAVLRQVPQQPMFDGRREDQIIALTFTNYLQSGDPDWPLLLPMVKAAVRGMDAVEQCASREWRLDIKHFTVAGASKRGWTTWLAAAADSRVSALAPMVINMLNMSAHDKLQLQSFGGYSDQVHDYTERRLQQALATPRGDALRQIVDPYAYRQQLVQPKLIILGSNDAYWPVDALNLYWNELQGSKYILYLPNSGHHIEDYDRILPALTALQRSISGGKAMPILSWRVREKRSSFQMELQTDVAPTKLRRWTATSDNQDFRQAKWVSKSVHADKGEPHKFTADLQASTDRFTGMFLEAVFDDTPSPFCLSTTLHVFAKEIDKEPLRSPAALDKRPR